MPLTATAIRHAKSGNKTRKMFDGGGLYLEISPSGGKWWRLKYRFGGKEKRISLGVYPDVSLKEVRRRREVARQLLAREIDPSEHRKAQKAAKSNGRPTISKLWPGNGSSSILPTGPRVTPAGSSAGWSGISSPGWETNPWPPSLLLNC